MITTRLRFLTAGESHGPELTAILEGLPAGLPLGPEIIDRELERRQRGYGAGPRMKIEHDQVRITSGVMNEVTIGSPVAMRIKNRNHDRWRRKPIDPFVTPRPGHVDLTGTVKYGYDDLRPALERASARETAARVAVGAVCKHLLAQFGITVFGYVTAVGAAEANLAKIPLDKRGSKAEESELRCPEEAAEPAMRSQVQQAIENGDTLGGTIEVAALGLPAGLGAHVHWDRRLEARLGAAVLSVQAIKGVEIGPAFENALRPGTQVQDEIRLAPENRTRMNTEDTDLSKIIRTNSRKPAQNEEQASTSNLHRPTNRAGGLEGGITTGQPLIVRAAMKPIASTLTLQKTINLATGKEAPTTYERSDFCPVPRAVPVIEAMVAFILADALLEKLGGDSLAEMLPRYDQLRQIKLQDLEMDNIQKIWWPK